MKGLFAIIMIGALSVNAAPSSAPVSGNNSTNPQENPVMYSYSEAVVSPEGKPEVSQLTIVKKKDGVFEYAKNTNGSVMRGKWEGPLPTTPETKIDEVVGNPTKSLTDDLVDPVKILQESIGSSVHELLKALNL